MQCEEDWLVMHALYAHHGWSISKIAREFGVTWRTAQRYATSEAVPRYRPRERPAELTEAQLAHVARRLDRCPTRGRRRSTGRSASSATWAPTLARPPGPSGPPARRGGRSGRAL